MNFLTYAMRVLLLLWVTGLAHAQQDAQQPPPDVRMLIDVSGSMKQNDPANLRQPAVDLLLQLLPKDSKAGVWTFGQYVNMLIPHKVVDEPWKQQALKNAEDINSVGLHTNIGAALEKAAYDSDRLSPDYRSSLVLLTDGMVDVDRNPSVNDKEWRRIVDEVLPALKQAGYTVHTIALSDNADTVLLEKLALATGGMFEVAQTADELMKIFLRVFDSAAPAEQVPLEGNTFLIDSSIEEFTALIFRQSDQPTQLISPDTAAYDVDSRDKDVSWYRTDEYDLITVRRPLEGEWRVVADMDPDSRVTVVSNLNMRVKPLPSNVFVDETAELSLLFQEQNKTVTDGRFLSLLSIDTLVQNEDTLDSWPEAIITSPAPPNGVFTRSLDMFHQEGSYQVVVQVDGKSFQRQFSHHITVRTAFSVELDEITQGGSEAWQLRARAHSDNLDLSALQVVARVKNPKGRSSIVPMALQANDEWMMVVSPDIQGRYEVQVRISGSDQQGRPVVFDSDLHTFDYPSANDPFAQPAPVAEPAAVPVAEPEPTAQVAGDEADDSADTTEEESSSMPLYIGLGVGNLLILVLAYFAYRMIMGKGSSLKELEESTEKATEDAAKAVAEEPAPEPEPEPMPEPEMESLDEDSLEQDTAPEEPEEVEPIEMDDGLDLASDDLDAIQIPEPEMEALDGGLDGVDEPDEEALAEETAGESDAESNDDDNPVMDNDADIDELLRGLEEPPEDVTESAENTTLFDEQEEAAEPDSEEEPDDFSMDDFSADVFDDEDEEDKDK